jgi:membrane protease YdiL (CAAX protease family)
LLENAQSPWVILYLALFAIVAAPVAEEFIFRGVLYPFLKRVGFPRLAWVGVSFVFALIHFDAATFAPLFVLAIVLTWLYERTDNLLAPIAAHSLFNAANFVMFFLTDSASQSHQK